MGDQIVLLVEDNGDDEWLALRALAKAGITNVTVARDGAAAVRLLHGDEQAGIPETCRPGVILLDLRLPRLDGIEILGRIRRDERTREIRVVVLTSSEDPHDKSQCRELGVTDFCSKPITEQCLLDLGLT
jgi:CheY-like chemotaxis protein